MNTNDYNVSKLSDISKDKTYLLGFKNILRSPRLCTVREINDEIVTLAYGEMCFRISQIDLDSGFATLTEI